METRIEHGRRDLVSDLIATYRDLNTRVRSLPEEQLRQGAGEVSVRAVVTRLRDTELRFSQALKERLTGVAMPEVFGEAEAPVLGTETEEDSTAVRISQFGTAREATLAQLRPLSDEGWNQELEGGKPICAQVEALIAHDRQQLERIAGLLGGGPRRTGTSETQPRAT